MSGQLADMAPILYLSRKCVFDQLDNISQAVSGCPRTTGQLVDVVEANWPSRSCVHGGRPTGPCGAYPIPRPRPTGPFHAVFRQLPGARPTGRCGSVGSQGFRSTGRPSPSSLMGPKPPGQLANTVPNTGPPGIRPTGQRTAISLYLAQEHRPTGCSPGRSFSSNVNAVAAGPSIISRPTGSRVRAKSQIRLRPARPTGCIFSSAAGHAFARLHRRLPWASPQTGQLADSPRRRRTSPGRAPGLPSLSCRYDVSPLSPERGTY